MSDSSARTRAIAAAAVLFAAITALRFADGNNASEPYTVLYVLPTALVALTFGLRGGLIAAALDLGLLALWVVTLDVDLSIVGWLVRATTFLVVGAGTGWVAQLRQQDEARSTRWFDMSNDMLAEASLDGFFTRLNGEWNKALGYSHNELTERPYTDFVHPDDLAATNEAGVKLAGHDAVIVNFENRYRHQDGSWRWLLWSASSDKERVYAVAKDITTRKQLEADRERLLERVEAMARTDELTGAPNRRAWEEELRRELARSQRHGFSVAVAVIDLDNFKAFNDEYGHPAGDELLRDAAVKWRAALRVSDFIARYGGEEFTVLLPGCPPSNGSDIIGRLRAVTPRAQTFSSGIAIWDGSETPEAVVERADQALYKAKRAGRDRTEVAAKTV